jgi:hypothetical protein
MKQLIFSILFLLLITPLCNATNYTEVNTIIESIETDIPKDLIKAIAWVESYWNQVGPDEEPFQHVNRNGSSDWGVMQINDATMYSGWDLEKVKNSLQYNIMVGVKILEWKLYDAPRIKEKYKVDDKTVLQVGIKMYNGWVVSWGYLERVEKILELKPWEKHLRREQMFTIEERNKQVLYWVQHHSYSQDLNQTLDTLGIMQYHTVDKKWKRVGYNELTEMYHDRPLTIAGRPILMNGAHTIGLNQKSYGSCLIGNYDKEAPSPIQWKHLIERALIVMITYKLPVENFIGHWESFLLLGKVRTKKEAWRKYKTCPGKKFDMYLFRNDLFKAYNKYMKV